MMRILHVVGALDRGGAETLLMNIFRTINREEVVFDFVVHGPANGEYYEEVEALGGKIYHCPRYKGFNHIAYIKWWKAFLLTHHEYRIVHGHVRSTAAIYLKIAKKCGKYTIVHSHSTSSGKGISAFVKKIFQTRIKYNADFFMGCSYAANKWLFGKKIANDKSKCLVLKNGIDLSKYFINMVKRDEIRNDLGVANKLVVGTVGRINVPKNPFFIIKIMAELLKIKQDSAFIWVGNGPLMEATKKKANELGVEKNIVFLGSRSNAYDYLQAMDVFLFPSLWEGLGMAVIEAQASGLPCACSNMIPSEADVTDLIRRIDLSDSSSEWAATVVEISQKNKNRHGRCKEVADCGYDIRVVSKTLMDIYSKAWRKEDEMSLVIRPDGARDKTDAEA